MKSQNYKDLLLELIKTNFKLRYNNSVLGFIWVLIKPFATFVILYTVWSQFRGLNTENYQVRLLLGIIMYTFINEGIILGMNALLDKSHIILKVNFPREIAVMSSVAMALINFFINLAIFVIFSLFNPVTPSLLGMLWVSIAIIATIFLVYSINLFLSVFLIKLRDLQHVFELLFQLLFWVTPIFYDIGSGDGQIGGKVGMLISYNPIGWLVRIAQDGLILGKVSILPIGGAQVHSGWVLMGMILLAIVLMITGQRYFNTQVKRIAEFF